MALRILTGMLFINGGPKNGRAIITHSPFRLSSAPSTVSLRKARGNISRAANSLGLSRQAFYRRMERFGLKT